MNQSPDITAKSWGMIAALGMIWGATFLGIELALKGLTPFWLAAGRIGMASVLMALIQIFRRRSLMLTSDSSWPWGGLIFIGILSSALPFMLLSWGQQFVTSGFAGVSMAAVALMVLPLAHFLIPGEQMTWRKSLGFAVGFAGVLLLIGGQAFESTGNSIEIYGRAACLGAAACYAVSSVLMRKLPTMDPIVLASVLLYIGATIVIPLAFIVEGPPTWPPHDALIALIVLALIPTAGANMLRVMVIRSAGPTFMSLTNYQVPVWSVLLGWLILKEPLPGSMLAALVLILSGVFLSQWGAIRRLISRG